MSEQSQTYLIKLTGLELFGYHGVFEHEKQYGQQFLVDCELSVRRAAGDAIAGTVSYAEVADLLEATFKSDRFDLIESVADALLAAVLSHDSNISHATISVHKPNAPLSQKFADVSVTVVGSR